MSETHDRVKIGLLSVSDRASAGVYEDKGIPALQAWLARALRNPIEWDTRVIPDEEALREAVAAATLGSAKETLALHETERWRAELVADDDALVRWLQAHPDTDTQHMRSLVRAARRDAVALAPEARQPKSHRDLFQFIKPRLTTP